jgi:hypothetical protein
LLFPSHDQAVAGGGYQYQQMIDGIVESNNRAAQMKKDITFADEMTAGFDRSADAFQSGYDSMGTTTISGNGITFTNPQDVQALEAELENMASYIREMQALNEQGLISDQELINAQTMAGEFQKMASDAAAIARNIEDLSLSELLGQSDGGQLGSMLDMVQKQLSEDADSESISGEFALASGRETEVSQFVEGDLSSQIANLTETFGADVGVSAAEAALNAIREGQTMGLSDEQMIGRSQFAAIQQLPMMGDAQNTLQGLGSGVTDVFNTMRTNMGVTEPTGPGVGAMTGADQVGVAGADAGMQFEQDAQAIQSTVEDLGTKISEQVEIAKAAFEDLSTTEMTIDTAEIEAGVGS